MKIARPSVDQERWLVLADRYAGLRALVEKSGRTGGWKTTTWLSRCLGFVLGVVGAGMLGGALSPAPWPLLWAGLLLMIIAEWLVAQRRVFRSGIEEAVYVCGAVAVVVQVLMWSRGSNEALGAALIASALLLVGWRLLNPLFTTLAAALYVLAIALVDASFLGRMNSLEAAVASAAIAVGALLAAGLSWRRPTHARMVDGLLITMPWLAYGWLVAYTPAGAATGNWTALGAATFFLAGTLLAGVKRRQHAPLIGALGNLVCVANALHRLLPWPLHWQLMAAGAAALVSAVLLDRGLRNRNAITSRAIVEPEGLDLAQLAGAASLSPAAPAPSHGVHGHGGEFGGGGATGRF
ncbi:MAG: hypothetical protein ABW278_13100 [Steroidobacteraceae bacterium]